MRYLAFFILTLLLWSCTSPSNPIDLEVEKTALEAAAKKYYQLMNDNDWASLEAIYSKSGKLIPDGKNIITGEEGIKGFVDGFKVRQNFSVRFEDLDVNMAASGDMGYSIATVTTTFQDTLGNDYGGANRDLHIWKKEAGEWKVTVDIWNTPAPAETPLEAVDSE